MRYFGSGCSHSACPENKPTAAVLRRCRKCQATSGNPPPGSLTAPPGRTGLFPPQGAALGHRPGRPPGAGRGRHLAAPARITPERRPRAGPRPARPPRGSGDGPRGKRHDSTRPAGEADTTLGGSGHDSTRPTGEADMTRGEATRLSGHDPRGKRTRPRREVDMTHREAPVCFTFMCSREKKKHNPPCLLLTSAVSGIVWACPSQKNVPKVLHKRQHQCLNTVKSLLVHAWRYLQSLPVNVPLLNCAVSPDS